ncbi:MAG: transposase [Candidatus Parvarchaeota archaeon]
MIVDVDTCASIVAELIPANTNDKKMFAPLNNKVKNGFVLQYGTKFLADAEYHSSKIYEQLRYDGITPVIPRSGNKYLKTVEPKEMGCGASLFKTKRNVWSCKEQIYQHKESRCACVRMPHRILDAICVRKLWK